ncbi:hypothetical protein HJFPF1_02126 [Paramyrothecium foliicola]|nr:hypothetical protein HJFPF1_02126 [Paramyrothecium foliicola]
MDQDASRRSIAAQVSQQPGGTLKPDVTMEDVLLKPWKYIGYQGYANFISSDDELLILRRFDKLNVRAMLALQDEISELEEDLSKLDTYYSAKATEDVHNGTFRDDVGDRKSLMQRITPKILQYNELVLQQSELRKHKGPLNQSVDSIKNWHHNHDYAAVSPDEQKYLEHDDLIAVVGQEKPPLSRLINNSTYLRSLGIWRQTNKTVPLHERGHVSYYSDKRIDRFATAAIVAVGVTMLITPLWILQAVQSIKGKLGIITSFIFLFLLTLSFAMATKPFEALGATAAYAAVLMVFIQYEPSG